MSKFEEEIEKVKGTNYAWIIPLAKKIARRDDLEEKLNSSDRSLKKCADYVISEARKRAKQSGSAVAGVYIDDNEVMGMMIHYYDENISVSAVADSNHIVVSEDNISEISEKESLLEKKIRAVEEKQKELEKKEEEIKQIRQNETAKKAKKGRKKKKKEDDNQLSIFDFLGGE